MAKRIILAVDDEPMFTRLAKVNLERAGYDVTAASNGIEALEILQLGDSLPDLILLDVTMPFMDGFELARRVRADERLKHIPIIMATARSHDADIIQGEMAGISHYLTKPINPQEMLDTVNEVLSRSGTDAAESP